MGLILFGLVVICVILGVKAIQSNPMYQEIKMHGRIIKELESRGQEQQILEEEIKFNKRMKELSGSDNVSSTPHGFF